MLCSYILTFVLFMIRAWFYCKSCHASVRDENQIKKCKCKNCRFCKFNSSFNNHGTCHNFSGKVSQWSPRCSACGESKWVIILEMSEKNEWKQGARARDVLESYILTTTTRLIFFFKKIKSVLIFHPQYSRFSFHVTDDDFDTIFCKCRILSTL